MSHCQLLYRRVARIEASRVPSKRRSRTSRFFVVSAVLRIRSSSLSSFPAFQLSSFFANGERPLARLSQLRTLYVRYYDRVGNGNFKYVTCFDFDRSNEQLPRNHVPAVALGTLHDFICRSTEYDSLRSRQYDRNNGAASPPGGAGKEEMIAEPNSMGYRFLLVAVNDKNMYCT